MSDPPDEGRGARWGHRVVADVLGVTVGCAATGALLSSERVVGAIPAGAASQLLTVVAAAAGGGAAILAVLASRLAGDRRPVWFAAAMVGYAVVVLPWVAVAPAATLELPDRASRLVAHLVALVLLVVSVRPPRRIGVPAIWLLLGVGGVLTVAALWLPPGAAVRGLVESPVPSVLILIGWTAAATGYVVDGARRCRGPELRIGLGLAVLVIAQLYRVVAVPAGGPELAFGGLRLLGLMIVLVGLAQGVRSGLNELRGVAWQQQEELAAAALLRERAGELAAERDHELRNGLAGLAGITHLLSTDDDRHEPLKNAVLAELGRLHMILDEAVGDPAKPDQVEPAVDYPVEPVLSGLVTLRRSGGDRVRLRVEPGLRARGRSAVLAQVVTNLLANCDRHAPRATVTVEARRGNGVVVVTVRDEGPGLSRRVTGSVLDRGIRDESAGGSGLGLHISRRLVAREGGTLTLRSVDDPRGCLATVTVPVAAAERPTGAASGAPSSR